jgi:predicted phage baseplate assembly protein
VVKEVKAWTIGGTVGAVQAEIIDEEVLGLSEGFAGQRFPINRAPIVPFGAPVVLEVSSGEGWEEWTEVSNFARSGPDDTHFLLDSVGGELVLGPAVRAETGEFLHFGAVPPKDAVLRIRRYCTGGGRQGNVSKGAIKASRTSVPFVTRVENRRAAAGGVDGESIEEAKIRGPIVLRTLDRAVTTEDYQELARAAAPEAARVKAIPALAAEEAGGVRLLVVPDVVEDPDERLRFEQLVPPPEMLSAIAEYLDPRRVIGTRVIVEPPSYQGVTVVASMRARPWADVARLRRKAENALYEYLHPIRGGMDGKGWPFGRPVHIGEIYALLQGVQGTEMIEDVRLFAANPLTGERGSPAQRVDVPPNALVFSYSHQVRVLED